MISPYFCTRNKYSSMCEFLGFGCFFVSYGRLLYISARRDGGT
nr:MAG TPA: hypothetical protein [Caudoviricetes sp.]